jgi:hypothetical protein
MKFRTIWTGFADFCKYSAVGVVVAGLTMQYDFYRCGKPDNYYIYMKYALIWPVLPFYVGGTYLLFGKEHLPVRKCI